MVGLADSTGNKSRFNNAISWHDFQETIEEERSDQLWQQASNHRGGQGMENGEDLSVSVRHYNRLVKDGHTDKAAALASITAGALWCPARLEEVGYRTRMRTPNAPAPYVGPSR